MKRILLILLTIVGLAFADNQVSELDTIVVTEKDVKEVGLTSDSLTKEQLTIEIKYIEKEIVNLQEQVDAIKEVLKEMK